MMTHNHVCPLEPSLAHNQTHKGLKIGLTIGLTIGLRTYHWITTNLLKMTERLLWDANSGRAWITGNSGEDIFQLAEPWPRYSLHQQVHDEEASSDFLFRYVYVRFRLRVFVALGYCAGYNTRSRIQKPRVLR